MNRITTLFLFVIIAVGIAAAGVKPITPPKFIPISIPGEMGTYVNGINNAGVMVGEYFQPGDYGFVLIGSKVITISVPNSSTTSAQGINSSNAIVGWYCGHHCNIDRGFLYQNGKFTDIGPQGLGTTARGINDAGLVVGTYFDGRAHGFVWDGQNYQTLDVPNSVETQAFGINNAGLITLQWVDSNNITHSALYDGTTYANIDVPGAVNSFASGINNFGDIVFTWDNGDNEFGSLLHDGQYHNFLVPGSNQTVGLGLNDQDIVVGADYLHNGPESGYKLIP